MPRRLQLEGLQIRVGTSVLVDDVGLAIEGGEVVGLVGASGSGKTLTARSLLGLVDIDPGVCQAELRIDLDGVTHRPYASCLGRGKWHRDRAFRHVRGDLIGYLPQDARAALDPLMRIGRQVAISARTNPDTAPTVPGCLRRAGFRNPERVLGLYPHELSGGMAQRAVIAQSIARGSAFLLADEPTTGLDPTVQVAIVDEIRSLADTGIGVLFITHDLRLLPGFADHLLVMHRGRLVERTQPGVLHTGHLASEHGRELVAATRRVAGGRLG